MICKFTLEYMCIWYQTASFLWLCAETFNISNRVHCYSPVECVELADASARSQIKNKAVWKTKKIPKRNIIVGKHEN